MNAVDYAADTYSPKSVMAVHYAGDYGDDAAAGAKLGAEAHGGKFSNVKTDAGQDNQAGAITAILTEKPALAILTPGPAETAATVGGAAQRGDTARLVAPRP